MWVRRQKTSKARLGDLISQPAGGEIISTFYSPQTQMINTSIFGNAHFMDAGLSKKYCLLVLVTGKGGVFLKELPHYNLCKQDT